MQQEELLEFLHRVERMKSVPRHSVTTDGIPESVAAHSWRLSLFALLLREEFPTLDMDRVLRMCVIHDIGEAVTDDIPTFLKTEQDEDTELDAIGQLLSILPARERAGFRALFDEMDALKSPEARLYKALDKLEAVIQHNESPLSSWIPLEYTLNQTYGAENAAEFPYLARLREMEKQTTIDKIEREGHV